MVRIPNWNRTSTLALRRRRVALLRQLRVPRTLLRGSLVQQRLTCGKPQCRCHQGKKHGPFYYLVRCLGPGKTLKFLLKRPVHRQQARRGIQAARRFQQQLEQLIQLNTELLRRGDFLE
jgi:hypothetical protein